MEYDKQKSYSRDEVMERMKKLIKDISYTLCLRETEPAVILMHLRWDLTCVINSLVEKKEELLEELGLKPVVLDSNQDLSNSSCGICSKTKDEFSVSNDGGEDESDDEDDENDDDGEIKGDVYVDGNGGVEDDDEDGDEDDDQGKGDGEDDDDDDDNDDDDDDDDDGDDLISTPFCFHKFCKTCWRKYLEKVFYSQEENLTTISCPNENCGSAVGKKND